MSWTLKKYLYRASVRLCRSGVMLLYMCSAEVGDVLYAPVMTRRQLFSIESSFCRCVGAAFSKIIDAYSRIGRMSDVYRRVSVALSPPHLVPASVLMMFMRLLAFAVV